MPWDVVPKCPVSRRDSSCAVSSAGQLSLNGPTRVDTEAGSFPGPGGVPVASAGPCTYPPSASLRRQSCHLPRRQEGPGAATVTLPVTSGRRGGGGIHVVKLV